MCVHVCVGSSPQPWMLHYFFKETIRNVCVGFFLLLGLFIVSLWKQWRLCVRGLLSSSDSSIFLDESNKKCMCVGSFPPPWILHAFLMKTIRNTCVCAGSFPPPWILHSFFMKTIRNVCVCVCGLLSSSSLDSSQFLNENNKECMCVCGLFSSSLDSWSFYCENTKECVCKEREREKEQKRDRERQRERERER